MQTMYICYFLQSKSLRLTTFFSLLLFWNDSCVAARSDALYIVISKVAVISKALPPSLGSTNFRQIGNTSSEFAQTYLFLTLSW